MKKTANLMDIGDGRDRLGYAPASACFDADALDRVLHKIELVGNRLCNMPDLELAAWLESLSREEFLEYMGLTILVRDR